jgi:hypothetical protein
MNKRAHTRPQAESNHNTHHARARAHSDGDGVPADEDGAAVERREEVVARIKVNVTVPAGRTQRHAATLYDDHGPSARNARAQKTETTHGRAREWQHGRAHTRKALKLPQRRTQRARAHKTRARDTHAPAGGVGDGDGGHVPEPRERLLQLLRGAAARHETAHTRDAVVVVGVLVR